MLKCRAVSLSAISAAASNKLKELNDLSNTLLARGAQRKAQDSAGHPWTSAASWFILYIHHSGLSWDVFSLFLALIVHFAHLQLTILITNRQQNKLNYLLDTPVRVNSLRSPVLD